MCPVHMEFQIIIFACFCFQIFFLCTWNPFLLFKGSSFCVFFFFGFPVCPNPFTSPHQPLSKLFFKKSSNLSHFYLSKNFPVCFLCPLSLIAGSDCLFVMERAASYKDGSGIWTKWIYSQSLWLLKQKMGGCLSKKGLA